MARPVLGDAEVDEALRAPELDGWHLVGGKLVRTQTLSSFAAALDFVVAVGALAEEANHHPDIVIRYDRVTLALVTHDSGGITRADLALARAVTALGAGGRTD
jgi:4a-hydroxytetrahydrobiopterin dehydratase